MQLKIKQLSLAVGSALAAGFAGHALALPPSAFDVNTSEIFMSGSSGQDAGIPVAMARMCLPGTLDVYTDTSNFNAFFCSANPTVIPGLTNSKIVLYKSSAGGSGNGVTPLIGAGTSLTFQSMATIKATPTLCVATTAQGSVTISGDPLGVPSYGRNNCSGTQTQSHVPDAGASDEEPQWFTDTTTGVSGATKNALVFGFAVSENLYRALQTMQALNATDTNADTTGLSSSVTGISGLPVRDNEANMPSLSRGVIGALMNGDILSWTSLRGPAGQQMTPTDSIVYIARRVNTSGTQKWSQQFLYGGITDPTLAVRCYTGARAMLTATVATSSSANGTGDCGNAGVNGNPNDANFNPTFQGSGSGDVRNCLAAHNGGGRFAIGIISTESTYTNQTTTPGGFRFIKVDGKSPSLFNVVTNQYKSWVEQSLNTSGTLRAGDPTKVINSLFTTMGSTSDIRALNQATPQPWGFGPLLQLPTLTAPTYPPGGLTQDNVQLTPINYYPKQGSGAVDNCQPAMPFNGLTDVQAD